MQSNFVWDLALVYGIAARSGSLPWAVAGFAIGAGWLLIGIADDVRYKSFFQRLKREPAIYRVRGGAGRRPASVGARPGRVVGAFTRPAFQICEPHVVLLSLTALEFFAIAMPSIWPWPWMAYVLAMAILAPLLAIARSSRAIARGIPDAEFADWFRVEGPDDWR